MYQAKTRNIGLEVEYLLTKQVEKILNRYKGKKTKLRHIALLVTKMSSKLEDVRSMGGEYYSYKLMWSWQVYENQDPNVLHIFISLHRMLYGSPMYIKSYHYQGVKEGYENKEQS